MKILDPSIIVAIKALMVDIDHLILSHTRNPDSENRNETIRVARHDVTKSLELVVSRALGQGSKDSI